MLPASSGLLPLPLLMLPLILTCYPLDVPPVTPTQPYPSSRRCTAAAKHLAFVSKSLLCLSCGDLIPNCLDLLVFCWCLRSQREMATQHAMFICPVMLNAYLRCHGNLIGDRQARIQDFGQGGPSGVLTPGAKICSKLLRTAGFWKNLGGKGRSPGPQGPLDPLVTDARYRWVPLNPNADNLNSLFIRKISWRKSPIPPVIHT